MSSMFEERVCRTCRYKSNNLFDYPCSHCASLEERPEWEPIVETVTEENSVPVEVDPKGLDPHFPGAKLDAGKVRASVLKHFGLALLKVAEVGTFGAEKYSFGGWQTVENGQARYEDAKWRHLLKADQEPTDADSELIHLAHEVWNGLATLELLLREEKSK